MTQDQIESALQQLTDKIVTIDSKVHSLEHENTAIKREASRKSDHEEAQLILSAWTKIVDTQMHFNEMVMKVRSLAITLILAAFGAAAYSVQTPLFLNVYERPVHVAFFIIIFGLTGWLALWVMDLGHFHKLLRGAVAKGMALEEQYKNHALVGGLLGMTTAISSESRTLMKIKVSAGKKIGIFYAVVFISGASFCWVALNYIHKNDLAIDHVMKITTDNLNGIVLRVEPPTLVLKDERVQEKQKSSNREKRATP